MKVPGDKPHPQSGNPDKISLHPSTGRHQQFVMIHPVIII